MRSAFRRALAVVVSASAMTILSGGLPLLAQESGKARAGADAKKKATDAGRRVPNYFGQLGLTEAQKESIYKIQAKHQPRIDALEKQLEELRAQSLKECEAVLTADQKKMLAERRSGAAESRAKKRAPAPAK
jgi:Spy/CpxP family protein refolding chaperone